jgi:3-dehydroquinate synthase
MRAMHTIPVDLGPRAYPVYLGAGLLAGLGPRCKEHGVRGPVVVLSDTNSGRAALRIATASLRGAAYEVLPLSMPPGEKQKSLARARALHAAMLRVEVPRAATVIALGGGVVGDVGGFVASTYRRGLTFVQCPTTLLSQVDSSVGGKNGVNHPLSKNAIGTFHQPAFVLSDVEVLASLPRREVIAGLGEILKYPLVADPALMTFLEEQYDKLLALDRETVIEVASRCLTIKSSLVAMDERELLSEKGRVFLNVGHAVGHALETLSHYALRHGEAVLLGILAEGWIAVRHTGFPEHEFQRYVDVYKRLGRRHSIEGITATAIVRAVLGRKGGRFVLPRAPGDVVVVNDVTEEELVGGLRFLRGLL